MDPTADSGEHVTRVVYTPEVLRSASDALEGTSSTIFFGVPKSSLRLDHKKGASEYRLSRAEILLPIFIGVLLIAFTLTTWILFDSSLRVATTITGLVLLTSVIVSVVRNFSLNLTLIALIVAPSDQARRAEARRLLKLLAQSDVESSDKAKTDSSND